MAKKKKVLKTVGDLEETVKAYRKASREAELEMNGGRWVAKDRPHKNLKKYDRNREKRRNQSSLFIFLISV